MEKRAVVIKLAGDREASQSMANVFVSKELDEAQQELRHTRAHLDILRKRNHIYWAAKRAHSDYLFNLWQKHQRRLDVRLRNWLDCRLVILTETLRLRFFAGKTKTNMPRGL